MEALRREFPILRVPVRGRRLVYLDNAATTQKPQSVIEAVARYYFRQNANIHRGVHYLSMEATQAYEEVREKTRRFLGARDTREIVFLRGTTEAVNLVAQSYGRPLLGPGDEILITHLEHHSNIVPWQMVCRQTGAILRVAPIDDRGEVVLEEWKQLLSPRTRIAAFAHVSNALGTINPIREMTALARAAGAAVFIDGAQAAAHTPIRVDEIDCDFYCVSGHKMYGPTGIGALYGRLELLESMPPYQGGGDMIASVTFEETVYNELPHKFEAGTPNIAGTIGLGKAIDFLQEHGLERIAAHEDALLDYGTNRLREIEGLRLVGTARHKAAILGFTVDGAHPHDVGTILDQEGIAVRAGHHCAQPAMERFGVAATVRASLGIYNDKDDIDDLIAGLHKVRELFG
ncbi:MAG: cysteine desulfurase [Candidatus Eisenbacteria bacterium]